VAAGIRGLIYRSVFFLGWLLSPLTAWNDAFVNIPLAYICASLAYRLAHFYGWPCPGYPLLLIASYWASNILGIALMHISGSRIVREEGFRKDAVLKTVLTVLIYSIILVLLSNSGILKPIPIPIPAKP
jgi:hypothetical protein